MVRAQRPQAKILALSMGKSVCPPECYDVEVIVADGPYTLLKKAAELLGPDAVERIKRRSERAAEKAKRPTTPTAL